MKAILAAFLFALGCPLGSFAAAIDQLPEIAKLPVIRIGVSDASGNGHQATSALVVTRLRELGYKGELEIIYHDAVADRMAFLFPPFVAEGPDVQTFREQGLRFVRDSFFKRQIEKIPEMAFGIIGADDTARDAGDFKVRTLLKLQPWKWRRGDSRISVKDDYGLDRYDLDSSALKDLFYLQDLPQPGDARSFIMEQMAHLSDQGHLRAPGVAHVYEARAHLDLAPAYGHGFDRLQSALYVSGLLSAMDEAPELFPRGVVVPVFKEFFDEVPRKISEILQAGPPNWQNRYSFAKVTDHDLQKRLSELKKNEVLIVEMKSVSKKVFEMFFQAATIAPVVEGLNTMNMMHLIGRPYLPSLEAESYQFYVLPEIAWAAESLSSIHIEDRGAISHFLIEARKPDSQISQFFAQRRADPHDLTRDKLFQGLQGARAALVAEEKKFASTEGVCARLFSKIKNAAAVESIINEMFK